MHEKATNIASDGTIASLYEKLSLFEQNRATLHLHKQQFGAFPSGLERLDILHRPTCITMATLTPDALDTNPEPFLTTSNLLHTNGTAATVCTH